MKKLLTIFTLLLLCVISFAQEFGIERNKIKAYTELSTDYKLVIGEDSITGTTQQNPTDTLLVTVDFLQTEIDTVSFSLKADSAMHAEKSDTSIVALRTQAQTNILRVDKDPNKGEYTTIQEAINYANTQLGIWQIQVSEGLYNEQLTLYDSINIRGIEDDMVVIQAACPVVTFAAEKSAIAEVSIIGTSSGPALYGTNTSTTSEIKIQNLDVTTVCCWMDFTSNGQFYINDTNFRSINTSTAALTNSLIKFRGSLTKIFNDNSFVTFDNRASGDMIVVDDSTSGRSIYGGLFVDVTMANALYTDQVTCFSLLGSNPVDVQNTIQNFAANNGALHYVNTSGGGDLHLDITASDLNFDSYSTFTGFTHTANDTINLNVPSVNRFITESGTGKINLLFNKDGALITNEDIRDQNMYLSESTNQSLRDFFNITASAGWTNGGDITNNGDGTVSVDAGSGLIRISNTDQSQIVMFDWADSLNIPITLENSTYIYIDYNSGVPIIKTTTNKDMVLNNENNMFELYEVYRESDELHITDHKHRAKNFAGRMQKYLYSRNEIERTSGLLIGETGTRNVTVTTGTIYLKLNNFLISTINTSTGGTFDRYYRDGVGGWTKTTGNTQWDNTLYDDGDGTLGSVGTSKYSYQDFWVDVEGQLISLYGQFVYNDLSSAQNAPFYSNIPGRLEEHSVYIGRIAFANNAATGSVLSVFSSEFGIGATVINHDDLAGINGNGTYHLSSTEVNYIYYFGDSVITVPAVALNISHRLSDNDISATNELNSVVGWDNLTNTISVTDPGGAKSAIITGFLEASDISLLRDSVAANTDSVAAYNLRLQTLEGSSHAAATLTSDDTGILSISGQDLTFNTTNVAKKNQDNNFSASQTVNGNVETKSGGLISDSGHGLTIGNSLQTNLGSINGVPGYMSIKSTGTRSIEVGSSTNGQLVLFDNANGSVDIEGELDVADNSVFGGNVEINNGALTSVRSLKIKGGTANNIYNATILLESGNADDNRGLGVYALQPAGGYEWYWGQSYIDTDVFSVHRKATVAHDINVADTVNRIFSIEPNGQVFHASANGNANRSALLSDVQSEITSGNFVSSTSAFGTDNRLVKTNGTGRGVQSSGITVDDSNNMTGVGNLSAAGGSFSNNVEITTSNLTPLKVTSNYSGSFGRVFTGLSTVAPIGTNESVILFGNAESSGNSGLLSFINSVTDGNEKISLGIYAKDNLFTLNGNGVGVFSGKVTGGAIGTGNFDYLLKSQFENASLDIDAASLSINGTSIGAGLWTESGGNVYRSTGNVGIGTTNPTEKLHVVGNGLFSGNATASQLISTGTTGIAPLDVSSTTKVDLLNSDQVDGFDLDQSLITTASPTFADIRLDDPTAAVGYVWTATDIDGNGNWQALPAGHDAVTLGVANGLSLSTQQLSMSLSSSTTTGTLSPTDWTTFNNKQAAYTNLTGIGSLANSAGWLYNNGSGTFSYSTPTKADVGLGNVENIALSTWTGTASITTVGTITNGTWQGTAIGDSYLTKTGNWTGTFDGQEGGYYLSRANHTGTQTAATISDFDTEVANNTAVAANTAKVSNATHTGDVTGSTALTIATGAVDESMLNMSNTASVNSTMVWDGTNMSWLNFEPQSTTTNIIINNDINHYLSVSGNTTLQFSGYLDGASGNIEVTYTGSAVLTFSEIITEVTDIKIADNIHNTGDQVLSKSSGVAVYSYLVIGDTIYITGTQTFN